MVRFLVIHSFQMVDKDHSFVKKSMFFVPVEIYVLDFESAVEKKQLESAIHKSLKQKAKQRKNLLK